MYPPEQKSWIRHWWGKDLQADLEGSKSEHIQSVPISWLVFLQPARKKHFIKINGLKKELNCHTSESDHQQGKGMVPKNCSIVCLVTELNCFSIVNFLLFSPVF